jgi:hypothetical protein
MFIWVYIHDGGTVAGRTDDQELHPQPRPNIGGHMNQLDQIARLKEMISQIRDMRSECLPKNNSNARYHAYSSAVSSLQKVIKDLYGEVH